MSDHDQDDEPYGPHELRDLSADLPPAAPAEYLPAGD